MQYMEYPVHKWVPLDPETDPASVAADQREAVEWALSEWGPDVEQISALICLPAFVVRKRILELSGAEVPTYWHMTKMNVKNKKKAWYCAESKRDYNQRQQQRKRNEQCRPL